MAVNVKIFKITVPPKNDLCCVICKIVNCKNNFMIYSDFCANKLTCRQFLQEIPQAMTAPVTNRKILKTGGSIYVIITREFFESCAFQDHCDALNVQVMDILDSIPTYIYKTCLLYTMEYKLSPQWNKVGKYLVEGRNFLSSIESVNAVTMDIKEIHDNNARLQVEAVNLKIPFVRLNAAHSSRHDIQAVRILPSMKMANVLNTSKIIKEKLFKDYEDLRTYWKNMYGYILPDYEEGFLFYDVEFFYFKSKVFLYPDTCLTSGPLHVLPSPTDPERIIYRFVGELGRVTKLCGQQLYICPENMYQNPQVYTPLLSRTCRSLKNDTGYDTQSRRVNSMASSFYSSDMCEIPTKRGRLSLLTHDSLICGSEFNLDSAITPTCSTSKFQPLEIIGDICISPLSSTLCEEYKSIIPKDESESSYFKKEKKLPQCNSSLMTLIDNKEESKKLSLKEKLLRARRDK